MGQIGNHTYTDTSAPVAATATGVGSHTFTNTDNQDTPCNGTDDCTDDDQDK